MTENLILATGDVPGHSFVQAATDRSFPIATLNRPGYEDSMPLPAPTFAGNAAAITRAIDDLWTQAGAGYPGGGSGRTLDG